MSYTDPLTYERLRYAPFDQDTFEYRAFVTGPYEMKGTGSNLEKVPFIGVNGDEAFWVYGVFRTGASGCPICRGSAGGTLLVNPLDWDHRYFICPICGGASKWECVGNIKYAKLSDDWEVRVATTKILDEDEDFPNNWM